MPANHPIPLILGPTGVGKTRVAYRLASLLGNAEIISADARSIFKEMDIGTDKPSREWREAIPHHLIDCVELDATYTAMDFRRDALRLIDEIHQRDHWAIVIGGTTLYVHVLTGKFFEGPSADPELRRTLSARPLDELYGELKDIDPESAIRIHPHDEQRIVRALEVYQLTGVTISELQRRSEKPPHSLLKIGLTCDRKVLHERIDSRVDEMMKLGLLNEVQHLAQKISPDAQAYKSNGYKELFNYLNGVWSLEEAIRKIKVNTHTHARRQFIFFKRVPGIHWIDVTTRAPEDVVEEILRMIQ
ncbi:tRNA (adenosine(37)-N6)-dimethylallyltransferase MiaA [Candidatus Acetothermia bacterium]|nr:tRNA (adenosine(37)-N6)-dimethylallyltransferase MiaA [Candidatus Acetothermia bacterium]MBI3643784.1 tRNA (adenosine(37)-N6)-dimethylallyltransferase MiaA [Candidatus Acetothermia bacterium]